MPIWRCSYIDHKESNRSMDLKHWSCIIFLEFQIGLGFFFSVFYRKPIEQKSTHNPPLRAFNWAEPYRNQLEKQDFVILCLQTLTTVPSSGSIKATPAFHFAKLQKVLSSENEQSSARFSNTMVFINKCEIAPL